MHTRLIPSLEPNEQVVYVAGPNTQGFWMAIGCGAIIGLFFFLLPGLLILLVGFIQYQRLKDAECIVTTKRVVISGWGVGRRVVEFEHQDIASISRSGAFSKTVTITEVNGRRVKLRNVAYDWELVETIRGLINTSQSP